MNNEVKWMRTCLIVPPVCYFVGKITDQVWPFWIGLACCLPLLFATLEGAWSNIERILQAQRTRR